MKEKGVSANSISNYLGTYSGFWNWAINSGELRDENPWKGQRKGLPAARKRKPLCPNLLDQACEKADQLEDVRFFFGRYQGLRKEDYCGLRWCDIDLKNGLIHLRRYSWEGKKQNLKLKEGHERSIPIHSQLLKRVEAYLPEAATRDDQQTIWNEGYKARLEFWGTTWADRCADRYGFGSQDLRSHVVTQMMKCNINPFFSMP